METIIQRPALTAEEVACLRAAPHQLWAAQNVAPGTTGGTISGLVRLGYLEPVREYIGRSPVEDYREYDVTELGRAIVADHANMAAIAWPPPIRTMVCIEMTEKSRWWPF